MAVTMTPPPMSLGTCLMAAALRNTRCRGLTLYNT